MGDKIPVVLVFGRWQEEVTPSPSSLLVGSVPSSPPLCPDRELIALRSRNNPLKPGLNENKGVKTQIKGIKRK